jgi:hypothetical protein
MHLLKNNNNNNNKVIRYGYERPTFYCKYMSMLLISDINSGDLVSPTN